MLPELLLAEADKVPLAEQDPARDDPAARR